MSNSKLNNFLHRELVVVVDVAHCLYYANDPNLAF